MQTTFFAPERPVSVWDLGLHFYFYQVLVPSDKTGLTTLGEIPVAIEVILVPTAIGPLSLLILVQFPTSEGGSKQRAAVLWGK